MLLLNEKETKIILDAMEFLETLGTPEATKQAELIDDVTYSQVNQDADIIDLLLGCFNELDNKYSRYELIENIIYRDSVDYHNELSEIEYYNCNDELGSYLKYYIEVGSDA